MDESENASVRLGTDDPGEFVPRTGDGEHGNPERATLDMIQAARGNDAYTIHFTFRENAHELETNQERKEALEKVHDWVGVKPNNCTVVFRSDDALSVSVDLLDPLYE